MLFLWYPKCSTCQKAKKWLDAQGISYEARHIGEENPSAEELFLWYRASGLPLKKFFNTSGQKYRELGLTDCPAGKRRNVSQTSHYRRWRQRSGRI